jgi:hypothetical protein
LSYKDFKTFFSELEAFKASMHGAPGGTYSHSFTLLEADAGVLLTIEVERRKSYAKRAKDAPRVLPAHSLPLEENHKNLAQQALQKPSVKRAFADAFPDVDDAVKAELISLVNETLGVPPWKKTRIAAALTKVPSTRAVARALDALWACIPFTQTRLCTSLHDYEARRAHFEQLHQLLTSDPPRLGEVPAFADLVRRANKAEPLQRCGGGAS